MTISKDVCPVLISPQRSAMQLPARLSKAHTVTSLHSESRDKDFQGAKSSSSVTHTEQWWSVTWRPCMHALYYWVWDSLRVSAHKCFPIIMPMQALEPLSCLRFETALWWRLWRRIEAILTLYSSTKCPGKSLCNLVQFHISRRSPRMSLFGL